MTTQEIRERLLTDDDFVVKETKRIQYLYGLKHETRYDLPRQEAIASESVAEHVYAMHILAQYFIPLETTSHQLDFAKVQTMITLHDIDEIETGDMIGYLKTPAIRAAEADAAKRVVERMPEHMRELAMTTLEEYESLSTAEAKFVKALDRLEPLFQMYTKHGKATLERNQTTREQSDGIKYPYVEAYPTMKRFVDVVSGLMEKEGYYH